MKPLPRPFKNALLVTAMSLAISVSSHAVIIGNDLTVSYDNASDGGEAYIVFQPPAFDLNNIASITAANLYHGAFPYVSSQDISFFLIRPVSGTTYEYIYIENETVTDSPTAGIRNFTFTSPWSVQSGDLLGFYGKGAAYSATGNGNLYSFPGISIGQTVDLNTLSFYGTRQYAVNFDAVAVPEPSVGILVGLAGCSLLTSRLLRRRRVG